MSILPALPVPAPEPLGLRYGLFAVAAGPLELPDGGRGGGITYEPVSCGTARRYPLICHTDEYAAAKVFDPGDDFTAAEPFVVYATYLCGGAGHTAAQIEDKVRRRLANGEQGAVEAQLAQDLEDAVIADGTALTPANPADILSVVGELEQWLYGTAGYGNIGFLHAPFRVASVADMTVVEDGPIRRTHLGTRWVFGNYPDGTLFISGHTTVWRSTDVLVPPAAQTFDREANQWNGLAEREYAVGFDCLAASAPYDHGAAS